MVATLATFWQRAVRLGEAGADGQRRSWIMLMPEGTFEHPDYGELEFSQKKLEKFQQNFDQRVRKIDVALDVDHKGASTDSRATGWIERVELRDAQGTQPAGLWGLIAWTPYGAKLLKDREYRYFSPEFGKYTDEETGETFDDVIIGGALTNRPFLKIMPSVTLAETSSKAWGGIKKSTLPRACFLIQGDADHKDTWKLPVYESDGKGGRGALNLNGVKAAWAAVNGAHTGAPMDVPSAVKGQLRRWMAQYFGNAAKAAGETNMRVDGETIRLMGAGGKAKKAPPKPADDDEELDDTEEMADDEEGATYAEEDAEDEEDGGDDEEEEQGKGDDEDEEEPAPKAKKLRSKRMGGGLANFGSKKAPPFKAGGKRMSETSEAYFLREQVATMREELETQRYTLYEHNVGKILSAWREGQAIEFQLTESAVRDPRPGKGLVRSGRVVLAPKAERKIRAYLLSQEGYRLSDTQRLRFLDVVQTCLSEALVDLSVRGAAWDQEARETIRRRSSARGPESELQLQETAERFAAADRKTLGQLTGADAEKYYLLAANEVGYRG